MPLLAEYNSKVDMVDTTQERLDELLRTLIDFGYEILHNVPREAVVRSPDNDGVVILTSSDDWVRIAQMVIEAGQLQTSEHQADAHVLALKLNGRFLGCQLGFDDEQNLAVQYDVYPDLPAEHVVVALKQLCYVGGAVLPLFEQVIASGQLMDDASIDRAFGVEAETQPAS